MGSTPVALRCSGGSTLSCPLVNLKKVRVLDYGDGGPQDAGAEAAASYGHAGSGALVHPDSRGPMSGRAEAGETRRT